MHSEGAVACELNSQATAPFFTTNICNIGYIPLKEG